MIIYQADKSRFIKDVFRSDIETIVFDAYVRRTGRRVAREEIRSWASSLVYMGKVLDDPSVPDVAQPDRAVAHVQ